MSGETQIIEEVENIQPARPVIEDRRARVRSCPLHLREDEEHGWVVVAFVGGWFPASPYEKKLWDLLVEARKENAMLKAQNKILARMAKR